MYNINKHNPILATSVISVAIEPETEVEKLEMALLTLAEEDQSFEAYIDIEGKITIAGTGEKHLDNIKDKLLRKCKVRAKISAPKTVYKETLEKDIYIDSKYVRQCGGISHYGHCKIHFSRLDPNEKNNYKFKSSIVNGDILKEYISSVDKGIRDAMTSGVIAHYEVIGIIADCYGGSYNADSSEKAFLMAGALALKDAIKKAGIILEPIMKVIIIIPENYIYDVEHDISLRRGIVQEIEIIANTVTIEALIPMSELFGYKDILYSITQGCGKSSIEFARYEHYPKKNVNFGIL